MTAMRSLCVRPPSWQKRSLPAFRRFTDTEAAAALRGPTMNRADYFDFTDTPSLTSDEFAVRIPAGITSVPAQIAATRATDLSRRVGRVRRGLEFRRRTFAEGRVPEHCTSAGTESGSRLGARGHEAHFIPRGRPAARVVAA